MLAINFKVRFKENILHTKQQYKISVVSYKITEIVTLIYKTSSSN